jgi:hypothetical protein
MSTNILRRLALTCAALVLSSLSLLAAVTSTITTGQPAANGVVKVDVLDLNGQIRSTATANITAAMTPAQKADAICAALNAQFLADGNNFIFSAAVAGNAVTVTKVGGGGMKVTILADTTGEGNNLSAAPGLGNGDHWFWRWVRTWSTSADSQVPVAGLTGLLYFDSPIGYGSETIVSDGVRTLGQLQDELSARLAGSGYTFVANTVLDPVNGDRIELESQALPDTLPTLLPNTFQFEHSPGWSDHFGTFEIEIVQLNIVGIPYCFGDGSLASPCPCGNFGLAGRGCDNSNATGGARLSATGHANQDDVVLLSTFELPHALTIFLQGNACLPQGQSFGDGTRCVGGGLRRIGSHNALGGIVSYPQTGDLPIRQKSAALGDPLLPGVIRYYQAYYRDPQTGFCPQPQGNSWNVSSALEVHWQ